MGSGSISGQQAALPPPSFQPAPLPALPGYLLPQTQAAILSRMLSRISPVLDTSEGSFLWDACAPASIELALTNQIARETLRRGFARTTFGAYLDLRAEEHGVFRRAATAATGSVTFTGRAGTVVPAGTRVSTASIGNQSAQTFTTQMAASVGNSGTVSTTVTALLPGAASNVGLATIGFMVDLVAGIASVTNPTATTGGQDAEGDPSLLNRLLYRVQLPSAGGNAADYINWALSVPGVGAVSVVPVALGNGTVSVALLDNGKLPAAQSIVDAVQSYISPPVLITYQAESSTPSDAVFYTGSGVSIDNSQTDAVGGSAVLMAYSPHLSTPAAPTLSAVATGTLVAGTYFYRVTATTAQGGETLASPTTTTQTGTTTNTSTSITGLTSTTNLSVGMPVSGTGIPVGAYITVINTSTAITISAAATSSSTPTLTFSSAITTTTTGGVVVRWLAVNNAAGYNVYGRPATTGNEGLLASVANVVLTGTTNGTTSVTGLSSTAKLYVGMPVVGSGIPASTTVAAINSSTSVTLSASATTSGSPSLIFHVLRWVDSGAATVGRLASAIAANTTGLTGPLPVLTWGTTGSLAGAPTTYSYRISATTAQGETPPGPASTVTITSGTNNAVTLSWAAVPNATGYNVYGRTAGSEGLLVKLSNVTTWTDTSALSVGTPLAANVTANTTVLASPPGPTFTNPQITGGYLNPSLQYYYRLTATNAVGETLPGPETSYQPPPGFATAQITLNWTGVPGATGYKVYRTGLANPNTGQELLVATLGNVLTWVDNTTVTPSGSMPVANTTATVSPAAPNTPMTVTAGTLAGASYGYRVSASNAQGECAPGTEALVTTTGANNQITLTWAPVAGATGYTVYGRTASGELRMAVWNGTTWSAGTGTANSWIDYGTVTPSGAMPSDSSQLPTPAQPLFGGTLATQTVAYRITGMDSAGNETLPGTESATLAITGPNGVVGLTWPAVNGAAGYRVYGRTQNAELLMSTWSGTAWTIGYGTATTWTDTGVVTPLGAQPTADSTISDGYIHQTVTPSSVPSPSKLPQAGLYSVRPYVKASALTGTITLTGTTTLGLATVSGLSSTASLLVGMAVSGVGIPPNTTILSINTSSSITLSTTATAGGSGVSLTFGSAMPVFQFGMWSVSANNWCPTAVSGPYGQAVQTLTAAQLSTIYGPVVQQFYNNASDNIEARMIRLSPLQQAQPAAPAVTAQNSTATLPSGTYTVQVAVRTLGGSSIASPQSGTTFTLTANTHSTTTVDGFSSTASLAVGMPVSGAGIPVNTTVATIVSGTAITISNAATTTASGVTLTFITGLAVLQTQGILVTLPAMPLGGVSRDIYLSSYTGSASPVPLLGWVGNTTATAANSTFLISGPALIGAVQPPTINTTVPDVTTNIWVDQIGYRSVFSMLNANSLSPVGARVTVQAAQAVPLTIIVHLVVQVGQNVSTVQAAVQQSITNYLASIAFSPTDNTVKFAQVGAAILNTPGVVSYDTSTFTINGTTTNVLIGAQQVATLGSVTFI